MSSNVTPIKKKSAPAVEIGSSGLRQVGGVIYEEYLRELQGPRWQRTIRQMVCDPLIGGLLLALENLIKQVQWNVTAGDDSAEAKEAADFVESCRNDMSASWQEILAEILSFLPWGWSYLETVYKVRSGDSDDPSTRSKYNDNRIGWRKWAIRSQDTLDHWEFDESGGVRGMWQSDPYRTGSSRILIPIEKALLFRASSRKSNPEGVSLFRSAYEYWYIRRQIVRIEAIGIERDLAGYPVFRIPSEQIVGNTEIYQGYKNAGANIRRDEQECLILPSDRDENGDPWYDFELASTGGTRQFDTDKIINRYDQRIAASVLMDFILLGSSSVGSYALSKDKTQIFTTSLKSYCDAIASVVNRHAIPRLLRLNGMKLDALPELQPGNVDSIDLGMVGDYISKLAAAGMMIFPTTDGKLESSLIEASGFPAPSPESFAEEAQRKQEDAAAMRDAIAKAKAQQPPAPAASGVSG